MRTEDGARGRGCEAPGVVETARLVELDAVPVRGRLRHRLRAGRGCKAADERKDRGSRHGHKTTVSVAGFTTEARHDGNVTCVTSSGHGNPSRRPETRRPETRRPETRRADRVSEDRVRER
ncbi:hypothetical protein GCM10009831_33890 [Dietzia cercidiphylli]|uniref:Uncharacterized protein n=1 Tax=Dietzia cercidiphylli TaxID=498199 RepID=A0ABN2J9V8_9ACTN